MACQGDGKLDGVECAKTSGQTVPCEEQLGEVELVACDREHRPQPRGDVGQEPSSEQGKVSSGNLPGSDLASENRLEFNHSKLGEEAASSGLGKEGIDLDSPRFRQLGVCPRISPRGPIAPV